MDRLEASDLVARTPRRDPSVTPRGRGETPVPAAPAGHLPPGIARFEVNSGGALSQDVVRRALADASDWYFRLSIVLGGTPENERRDRKIKDLEQQAYDGPDVFTSDRMHDEIRQLDQMEICLNEVRSRRSARNDPRPRRPRCVAVRRRGSRRVTATRAGPNSGDPDPDGDQPPLAARDYCGSCP
jgi:hypothetical protein